MQVGDLQKMPRQRRKFLLTEMYFDAPSGLLTIFLMPTL